MKLKTLCEDSVQFARMVGEYLLDNGIPADRVHMTLDPRYPEVNVHHPERRAHEPYIRLVFYDGGQLRGHFGFRLAQKYLKVSMFDPDSFPKILRFVKEHPDTYEA